MTLLPDVSAELDPTQAIQDFINANDYIEFTPGVTYEITTSLEIPAGKTLTTDKSNPAIIQRMGSLARTMIVNGNNVSILNLTFDWGFRGTYQQFRTHISTNPVDGSPITPSGQYNNMTVAGCYFTEIGGDFGTHAGGDCWCISMNPGISATDTSGVRILGNVSDQECQLTGNGTRGGTLSDVEIAYNRIRNGRAGSIAISSLASEASDRFTVYDDIRIHHNAIRDAMSTSVFIGQDTDSTVNGRVTITGLNIYNNYFHDRGSSEFPIAVLIRAGSESGQSAQAVVNNNIFDTRTARAAGNSPGLVTMSGGSPTNGTLTFTNNKIIWLGDIRHDQCGRDPIRQHQPPFRRHMESITWHRLLSSDDNYRCLTTYS